MPAGSCDKGGWAMRQRGQALGILLVMASTLGFAGTPTLTRLAYEAGINVPTALALRFGLAALLAWPFLLVRGQGRLPVRQFAGLMLTGLFFAANTSTFFVAVSYAPASTVALVFYVYPAIVTLLSVLVLGERLTPLRGAALALAIFGCGLTLGFDLSGMSTRGLLLALVSAACYAVYIVLGSRLARGIPVAVASTWMMTGMASVFLGYALLSGSFDLGFQPRGWVVMGLLVLVATVLAVFCFLAGVLRLGPAKASIIATIEPVFAVALAAAILDERLKLVQLLGGLAIFTAVLLLRLPAAERAPEPDPRPVPLGNGPQA